MEETLLKNRSEKKRRLKYNDSIAHGLLYKIREAQIREDTKNVS
jgi:hypothetical protein